MRRPVLLAISILFLWTNPSTNQDGTPCTDLAKIVIRGVREATGHNEFFQHPLCSQTSDGVVCLSGPGQPDSMRVEFPQYEGDDWWYFDAWAYDSTGNESWPSDDVRLNLGRGGPITGVDTTIVLTPPASRWYDVQGRRVSAPGGNGIWFEVVGTTTFKVVRYGGTTFSRTRSR